MKAFVCYNEKGRITSVGVPNPEFGNDLVPEASEGDAVISVDVGDVVKGAGRLTFATGNQEDAKRLQDVVRTIAEQYRVEPSTRRLVPR